MWRTLVGLLFACFLVSPALAQEPGDEPPTFDGKVTDVTVYQGQALVTRTVDLPSQKGLAEVVVSNLPEFVMPGSIYAEPVSEGVEIRSVRYRVRPMEQDVRAEVRELDDQIKTLSQETDATQRAKQLLEERKQYLTKLENFTTGTAKTELESGVLNAETLKDMTEFLFKEREQIAEKDLELSRTLERLQTEVSLLQRQRSQIAAGSAKSVREAVVFVNVPAGEKSQLKLNYLVLNATWNPSYNLRTTAERDVVTVEYNAAIEQLSGEDWNNVTMTLSTATPSLVASAPSLDPLVVSLGRIEPATASAELSQREMMSKIEIWKRQQLVADNRGNGNFDNFSAFDAPNAPAMPGSGGGGGQAAGFGRGDQIAQQPSDPSDLYKAAEQADGELNELAEQLQVMEYNMARFEAKKDEGPRTVAGEGVSVSYKLANRLTLPSRSDKQLLQISSRKLSGDFYRVATPVLTSYVYEECRLTNNTGEVMLAGPSSTFVAGQFVGRGSVPTVASGETFRVGLGIDTSLRATRSLVDKTERISGGNRVVDFTYELAIENFGDEATKVRMLDRMPTSKQTDMKITLVKSDKAVSEDASYQLEGLDEGLLRWDIEVPAGAIGPQHLTLNYTMQMEYDKQLSIESKMVSP